MGKANLYTVKDYLTGEVLAKGTAGEPGGQRHRAEGLPHQRVGQAREQPDDGPEVQHRQRACCIRRTAPGGEKKAGR